jgi:hypothetical protein
VAISSGAGVVTMNEEQRRMKAQWKTAQRDAARAAFPLPEVELAAMFDAVHAAVERDGCDNTLRATRVWLAGRQSDAAVVLGWLAEHGGYCDCEVVANAGDHYEQTRSQP